MNDTKELTALQEALRHCGAATKAIEAARDRVRAGERVYPTHLHLAAVELAQAIEIAMKVAMRSD
jgi:hypothetical protein